MIHQTDTVIHRTDPRDLSDRGTLAQTIAPQPISWFFLTLQEFQEYPKDTKCVAYHAHGVRVCHVPTVALRTPDPVRLRRHSTLKLKQTAISSGQSLFRSPVDCSPRKKTGVCGEQSEASALRNTQISRRNRARRQDIVHLLIQGAGC